MTCAVACSCSSICCVVCISGLCWFAAVPGGVEVRGSSRCHIFDFYFGPGLLVVAAVPSGVKIRGLHNWHLMKTIESDTLLVCVDSVCNMLCLLAFSSYFNGCAVIKFVQVGNVGTLSLNCDEVAE